MSFVYLHGPFQTVSVWAGGPAASNAPLPGNGLSRYVAKLYPFVHPPAHYDYSRPPDSTNEVTRSRGTQGDIGRAFDAPPPIQTPKGRDCQEGTCRFQFLAWGTGHSVGYAFSEGGLEPSGLKSGPLVEKILSTVPLRSLSNTGPTTSV